MPLRFFVGTFDSSASDRLIPPGATSRGAIQHRMPRASSSAQTSVVK
ncbi:MAG TPA: hypothetical protein VGA33_10340 [Thermoanaerobaculia bacterium]